MLRWLNIEIFLLFILAIRTSYSLKIYSKRERVITILSFDCYSPSLTVNQSQFICLLQFFLWVSPCKITQGPFLKLRLWKNMWMRNTGMSLNNYCQQQAPKSNLRKEMWILASIFTALLLLQAMIGIKILSLFLQIEQEWNGKMFCDKKHGYNQSLSIVGRKKSWMYSIAIVAAEEMLV